MMTIIKLILTLLFSGLAAPAILAFTIAGCMTLQEQGHSTLSTLLPWIVLIVSIILMKLLYKLIGYLLRSIFG